MYKNYENLYFKLLSCTDRQDHVTTLVRRLGPYRFFVTLTFQYRLSDQEGIEAASVFIRRLNRKLFKRNWRNQGHFLRGVAFLERASIAKREHGKDRGNCHFHFLIEDPVLKDKPLLDRCGAVAAREMGKAAAAAGSCLNYKGTRKLVSKRGTKVKHITDHKRTVSYVTKEARNPSWWTEDRFFLFDVQGMVPASIPVSLKLLPQKV